jgi:hypothetical protein
LRISVASAALEHIEENHGAVIVGSNGTGGGRRGDGAVNKKTFGFVLSGEENHSLAAVWGFFRLYAAKER